MDLNELLLALVQIVEQKLLYQLVDTLIAHSWFRLMEKRHHIGLYLIFNYVFSVVAVYVY